MNNSAKADQMFRGQLAKTVNEFNRSGKVEMLGPLLSRIQRPDCTGERSFIGISQ